MLTFLIAVGSIALVFLCAWLILLILMQKPSANAGMGAALGGGAAEAAFGGEASNVLTRWTVFGVVGFFLLTLSLSLGQVYRHHHDESKKELAPMAEEAPEAPKSLTQLPTDAEPSKTDGSKKTDAEASPATEASQAGTSTVDGSKAAATASDASKKAETSAGTDAKATDTKKKSKSKISYRSAVKTDANQKSGSADKRSSKNAGTKETSSQGDKAVGR